MQKKKMNRQCAICRRAGEKLFLKGEKCQGPKCLLLKRNFIPGQHGNKRKHAKLSVYGKQLAEKRKVQKIYGLRERQFANYVKEAATKKGNTGEYLLNFLEARLDNVVYRIGLASSRRMARQITNHGLIAVNGKKLDVPSYRVRVGDIITVKETAKQKTLFNKISEKLAKIEATSWLAVDAKQVSAKMLNVPSVETPSFDIKLVIEFYSRKL